MNSRVITIISTSSILQLTYFLCLPLRTYSSANNATVVEGEVKLPALGKHMLYQNKTSPPVANTTISGLASNEPPHRYDRTSSSSTLMVVTSGIYDESVLFQMAVWPVMFKSSDWLEETENSAMARLW